MFFGKKKKKEEPVKEQERQSEQNQRPEMDPTMKDGDTIDGIKDGRIIQDIQWKCRYEDALIQPGRAVIDVCMGEYAAGNRG